LHFLSNETVFLFIIARGGGKRKLTAKSAKP
jgi:hypothetical protein